MPERDVLMDLLDVLLLAAPALVSLWLVGALGRLKERN